MNKKNFLIISAVSLSLIILISIINFLILSSSIDKKLKNNNNNVLIATKEGEEFQDDYSQLTAKLLNSVVNLEVSSKEEVVDPMIDLLKNMPLSNKMLNDLTRQKRKKKVKHIGSGFYFNNEGYIITNAHVIENAEEVKVKDFEENEFIAKIIGFDKITDIGVLKIEKKNQLKIAVLGDSSKIKTGEKVITIGNPFNLTNTVTTGIISAKERKLDNPFVNFIQTDSAINRGNSGGAMFNLKGEIIGVNTLILSQNGGNIGLGFAIPSNLVKEIANKIISEGKIIRAKAGVMCRNLDENTEKALKIKEGALVVNLDKKADIFKSGLKKGDVVIAVDKEKIKDCKNLAYIVSKKNPNGKINIEIFRYGKKLNITAQLMKREEDVETKIETKSKMIKGILIEEMGADENNNFTERGVVIQNIENEFILEEDNLLLPGDIIYQINEESVKDINSFEKALNALKNNYAIFYIKRNSEELILGVKFEG